MQGDGIQRTSIFQEWDEAHFSISGAPGSRSDLDVCFYLNNSPVARGKDSNIDGNPVKILTISPPPTGSILTDDFFIVHRGGPLPTYMKFVVFGQAPISIEFATNSATSFGHSNVVSVAGVGVFFSTMIHLILGSHPLFFRGRNSHSAVQVGCSLVEP
jgi:hypothetical protein